MDRTEATTRLLDAAEDLFYERGVQAVGIDEIRSASGVSLKRLYQCFSSKEELAVAYLRRRDERLRASLADFVGTRPPAERVPAVFDWLLDFFSDSGFRGCAFLNSVGEMGAMSPAIVDVARNHKEALRVSLTELVEECSVRHPAAVADQVLLLLEGAVVSATIDGDPGVARRARVAATALINAASGTARPAPGGP